MLLGIATVGCKSPARSASPVTKADDVSTSVSKANLVSNAGWTRIQSEDHKISIGLPPNWQALTLSKATFNQNMSDEAKHSRFVDTNKGASTKAVNDDKVKLMFGHNIPGSSLTQRGLLMLCGATNGKTLDEVADDNLATFRAQQISTKMQTVSLPVGDCREFSFSTEIRGLDLNINCFVVIRENNVYELTLTVSEGQKDDSPLALSIAKTLQFGTSQR